MIMHIKIKGRVQGVGFREWLARKSREYPSIQGWVRNRHEGWVEVLFEGESGEIDEFLHDCHKGPVFSRVDKVEMVKGIDSVLIPIKKGSFVVERTV